MAASVVFAIGAVCGLAVSELTVRRRSAAAPAQPRTWPRLVKTAFPIGVAFLLFILLMRLDVTLLSFIAGEEEVGLYAAAYRLVESTQFVAWSLSAAMMPWLARTAAGGLTRGYELALKAMNAVLLPLSLVFVLFAKPLIDLLYGAAYEPAVLPLQLLGLTSALYGMQTLASTTLIARNSPGTFGRLVGVVVVLNLSANLIVIPRYGADGAAAVALGLGRGAGRRERAAGGAPRRPRALLALVRRPGPGRRRDDGVRAGGAVAAGAGGRARARGLRRGAVRGRAAAVRRRPRGLRARPARPRQRLVSVQIPKRSAIGLSQSSNGTRARSPYTTG